MSETTFTPGPWEFVAVQDKPGCWRYWVEGPPMYDYEFENEADARLIAAAPELLAALKRWHEEESTDGDMTDYAIAGRIAIAKAEGTPVDPLGRPYAPALTPEEEARGA